MMEFNAILSIEPCPHKDVFWLHLSSGFRIEIDALKVSLKWGREKFEKFKIANDLIYTETMPWDKDDDEFEKEYKELFPPIKRRFTFSEIKKKYAKIKT